MSKALKKNNGKLNMRLCQKKYFVAGFQSLLDKQAPKVILTSKLLMQGKPARQIMLFGCGRMTRTYVGLMALLTNAQHSERGLKVSFPRDKSCRRLQFSTGRVGAELWKTLLQTLYLHFGCTYTQSLQLPVFFIHTIPGYAPFATFIASSFCFLLG